MYNFTNKSKFIYFFKEFSNKNDKTTNILKNYKKNNKKTYFMTIYDKNFK